MQRAMQLKFFTRIGTLWNCVIMLLSIIGMCAEGTIYAKSYVTKDLYTHCRPMELS